MKIFVNAASAIDADLVVRYQVGAAGWSPFYDARLATGAKGQAAKKDRDSSAPSLGESAQILDGEAKKAYRLGEIFLARRRWAAAAHEYGRARAKVKDAVPALSRRYALACLQIKKLDEALEALVGATTTDPTDEASQALLGRVYVTKGDFRKARTALDAGLAVDPFDPDLHATYVQVAAGLNDKELEAREKKMLAIAIGRAPSEDKTP